MKRFAGFTAMLVMLTGCHWRAEAEDFKQKWVEECRYHYQTQMIKSAEIAKLCSELDSLRAENMTLKMQVEAAKRPAETK